MIPVHDFSTSVLAQIVRRQPPSQARTNFAWQLAVGQAVARATTVALKDGVLTVRAVDRRWMRELDPMRGPILDKLQHLLGKEQVTRIDLGGPGL
jgi:predicted nucleic acid-binding Zn ribbon protein